LGCHEEAIFNDPSKNPETTTEGCIHSVTAFDDRIFSIAMLEDSAEGRQGAFYMEVNHSYRGKLVSQSNSKSAGVKETEEAARSRGLRLVSTSTVVTKMK
jgi:hypothetical protein